MGYQTDFNGHVEIKPTLTAHEVHELVKFANERIWCKWEPNEDGTLLTWNYDEKFYDAAEWMKYLVDRLAATGHVLNGTIEARGEEWDDRWDLIVEDNVVYVDTYAFVVYHRREVR
jgi:hypothetical protein